MGNVPPALRFLNSRRKRREISMGKLSCSHMGRRNGATPVCPDIPERIESAAAAARNFYEKIIVFLHRERKWCHSRLSPHSPRIPPQ
jgi:hypothetical protein